MIALHNDIERAKDLCHRMITAGCPTTLRRLRRTAIADCTLEEIHTIVLPAEISAALLLSQRHKKQDQTFNPQSFLQAHFSIKPEQKLDHPVSILARIMGFSISEVKQIMQDLGFAPQDDATTCPRHGEKKAA